MIKANRSLVDQTLTESLRMEKQDAQEDAEDRKRENEENKKRKKESLAIQKLFAWLKSSNLGLRLLAPLLLVMVL